MSRKILFPALAVIVSVIMIEIFLQVITSVSYEIPVLSKLKTVSRVDLEYLPYDDIRRPLEEVYWKSMFLKQMQARNNIPMSQGEYLHDRELGWIPRKNVVVRYRGTNSKITLNNSGARSLEEYVPDPGRFRVLIVGDSLTYGSEADDHEVWPTILQSLNENIQVFNFAVGGYGIDQMYLMLERTIHDFKPDLVIFAYVSDSLHRSMLKFRGFRKPYLETGGGRIRITNVPVLDLATEIAAIKSEFNKPWSVLRKYIFRLRVTGILYNAYFHLTVPKRKKEMILKNTIIMDEAISLSESNGSGLLLLYLPTAMEMFLGKKTHYGEIFFNEFTNQRNINSLNLRPLFIKYGLGKFVYPGYHYRYESALMVAVAVNDKIAGTASYRQHMLRAE
jgi:hypothetical protein